MNKLLLKDWIVGFTDGEGCFSVTVPKNKESKFGKTVHTTFTITQHMKDEEVLKAIQEFFGGIGKIHKKSDSRTVLEYQVKAQKDLWNVIIPFFTENKLLTKKRLDFEDFKKVVCMKENKEHLSLEGLIKIEKITEGMNTGRFGIKVKKVKK